MHWYPKFHEDYSRVQAKITFEVAKVLKLSPQATWLLLHLDSLYPSGVASTNAINPPDEIKARVGMLVVRGLIRRGWVHEPHNGIFIITQKGQAVLGRAASKASDVVCEHGNKPVGNWCGCPPNVEFRTSLPCCEVAWSAPTPEVAQKLFEHWRSSSKGCRLK